MDATPTAGKVATIGGVNLALTLAKAAAGFAAGHGLIGTNNVEMWTGIIVLILTYGWSLWTDYGSVIAKASLDILRAKVLNAAELAQRRPAAAPAALAQLATHVEVTAPVPAPVITATPPVASAIVLAIGLAALGLGWPGTAHAQTPRAAPPKLTGNVAKDIGDAIKGDQSAAAQKSIEAFLAKPFQDLADFIASDSEAAITLSTVVPELQDGHGQQCWIATRQFGEVVKAHPVPLTLKAQTDLEAFRLLTMAANNLCANPHCTQVFADLGNAVQTMAPLNASIPVPSLHDLCAKVPQVAVVAPVSVPVPVPVTPTP